MGVSSRRSRVADLAFHVFGRAVHPDWYASRSHRRVSRTGWEADARIIEGGHAISWASGDARLTEILADTELFLPDSGRLFQSPVRRERSATLRPGARVEYQTCFEVERLDPEVFAHECEALALRGAPGDLFHRFAAGHRLAPAPISRLHLEPRGRGLSVSAFHTFPEDHAILRVQSLFEVVA